VTQTAPTWRFTRSASEPARPNRSKMCYIWKNIWKNICNVTKNTPFLAVEVVQRLAVDEAISVDARVDSLCFVNFFFRVVFCVKDHEAQKLTQEVTFVKCKNTWRTNPKKTPKR